MEIELGKIQPRYMFLDPHSGKSAEKIKSVRARSAIVVVGVDPYQRIWALDAWAGRVGTNAIVDAFVSMAVKWGVVVAGYEDVAQQSLLFDPLMNEAEKRGVQLPLTPVKVDTRMDKKWRIRTTLQPAIGAGRLIILEDLTELVNEITSFPMNARMDLVDCLATAVSLTPPLSTKSVAVDERRDLARFLRESGMTPTEIEDYMSRQYFDSMESVVQTSAGGGWWSKLRGT
jgi:hypothetical protein